MTTKPPSGLAASGSAEDADPDITKDHNEDGSSIRLDPSQDVTVEATEDVTQEAVGHTPPPSLRPGTAGVSPGQRAPTLLGVPIHSLPLPGVTTNSASGETTRTIDYDEEVTVLAQPTPVAAPLTISSSDVDLDSDLDPDLGPSVVDDDEEETKVEAAESAMKAAESMDDVTTALSAQASLEREKALRRTATTPSPSDDLEFADPDADERQDDEEESLDDELSDEDEVISAGGVVEEDDDIAAAADDDEDDDADTDGGEDDAHDGAPTATFMKSPDATGLSGLLNPRRPPTGGRDGFGSRLPTPYAGSGTGVPAPSTSPFASRLGPPPTGSPPYGARATSNTPMAAIQVPPPSGAATTATGPTFFSKQVPMPGVALLCFGFLALGFGLRGAFTGKSTPTPPTTIVAKPTATLPSPAAPVVEPVAHSTAATAEPVKGAVTAEPIRPAPTEVPPPAIQTGTEPDKAGGVDQALWKPGAKKPAPAPKPRKVAAVDAEEEAALKPAAAKPAVTTPKPAPAPKAKKPAKAWVDPFAQ
jgi:hypothetical protein